MIFFRLKPSRWEKHQHCHSSVLNVVWSLILLHLYSFIMIPVANADALLDCHALPAFQGHWEDWNDWDAGFCWSFTLVRDGRVWIFGPQVNQFGLRISPSCWKTAFRSIQDMNLQFSASWEQKEAAWSSGIQSLRPEWGRRHSEIPMRPFTISTVTTDLNAYFAIAKSSTVIPRNQNHMTGMLSSNDCPIFQESKKTTRQ